MSAQISENKGAKIPLTEGEIRQRSQNRQEKLQDRGHLKKWMAQLTFLDEKLHAKERLHAKNQLRQLVKSDAIILSIEYQAGNFANGNWIVIFYSRDVDDLKRSYYIRAKD